ncbi:DUF2515 family protein [Streptomyces johnsoniae]|uniref:Uncharacterized protein n=1 Tax=Streptomyces johnsoniae TaxID=3075532 RepID=A0ABU2S1T2_9ACTN|nr:hypothetical protein [Streptomyces sp. DSM 41886]MDT0442956.1 hypothetical protein [Streptomyces sp. DSM 41886]
MPPEPPNLHFTRDDVEAAAPGGKRPWTRQTEFDTEVDADAIADAAAAYGRAAAEALGAQDLAVRATEISARGGGLDGTALVDGEARIDETRGGLQDGGADVDAVVGHLVHAMNLALATKDDVRGLIHNPGGLDTKYGNHLGAAAEEWNGWARAFNDALAEYRGRVWFTEQPPPLIVSHNGEMVQASLTSNGYALPDDLAGRIREKHLRLAAGDAATTWDDIEAEIERYRRLMAERADELKRLGHDVSAGPLGLFSTAEMDRWANEQAFLELCRQLGIDPAAWDTTRGLSFNDDRITRVYEYYADLFLRNPELQWAGMAKLAGGLVYAGMQDLHVLRGLSGDERLSWIASAMPGMPPGLAMALATAGEAELDHYEDTFVAMQKEIFVDMGWQHAAYDRGGIEEMRRLAAGGELSPQLLTAWEDIASGDPQRIEQGNAALLRREQETILQDDYAAMQERDLGRAVTYMLGVTSESPVPGGRPFREVVNDVQVDLPDQIRMPVPALPGAGPVEVDIPDALTFDSPLPTGNIANFDSRWQWISQNMLPSYQALLDQDMERLRGEVGRPLNERAQDFRLVPLPYDPHDGVN